MKVTKVSCEVRFSKAVNESSWKTVGLAAEATLEGKELYHNGWKEAQKALHADLAAQLKELFTNGPQNAPDKSKETPKADPSWCSIHQCRMKRRRKGKQAWYSHQLEDGTWCKGKAKK